MMGGCLKALDAICHSFHHVAAWDGDVVHISGFIQIKDNQELIQTLRPSPARLRRSPLPEAEGSDLKFCPNKRVIRCWWCASRFDIGIDPPALFRYAARLEKLMQHLHFIL